MPLLPRTHQWLTTAGATLPLVCTVHCLMTPLLVAFAPVLIPSAALEAWLFPLSSALAIAVVGRDRRRHRSALPAGLVGAGVALWAIGFLNADTDGGEHVEMAAQLLVSGGVLTNLWRVHRSAECALCDCGDES